MTLLSTTTTTTLPYHPKKRNETTNLRLYRFSRRFTFRKQVYGKNISVNASKPRRQHAICSSSPSIRKIGFSHKLFGSETNPTRRFFYSFHYVLYSHRGVYNIYIQYFIRLIIIIIVVVVYI